MTTELRRRLVNGEARAVSGNLEQDPARLLKVYRTEVLSIDHRRNAQPLSFDLGSLFELIVIAGCPKGHMVNRSHAASPAPEAGGPAEVDHRTQSPLSRLKAE